MVRKGRKPWKKVPSIEEKENRRKKSMLHGLPYRKLRNACAFSTFRLFLPNFNIISRLDY
ncbi:hypothetical protein SLEP1_g17351 [Rubroshorea leprosula]|uniref:Ribosomal protein S14 n=1 Tax=Rubroshorea leprosula TaxID=152421 RepID=A0AAV5J316_9ROSI|nr:hypothetical protein SLEP1_g17351 [Rubroshorea leprosula]